MSGPSTGIGTASEGPTPYQGTSSMFESDCPSIFFCSEIKPKSSAKMVQAFAVVKDNVDSGQFKAIQKSGIYALDHPEISRAIAAKYARRMRGLVDALNAVGFRATMPKGSFFLYAAAPKGIRGGPAFKTAEEAS